MKPHHIAEQWAKLRAWAAGRGLFFALAERFPPIRSSAAKKKKKKKP